MITASSASQSTDSDTAGSTTSSFAPIERRDVLGEQRRVLGDVSPRLEDVVAVVQTDADDLLGPRDQRCEVEAGDWPGHPTRALGALTPSLVAKELAHIGGSDVDRRVAVHTDRTRAVTVSNRRKLHGGEYDTGRDDAVTEPRRSRATLTM